MKNLIVFLTQNLHPLQIITKNSFWITLGKILGGVLRALLVIFSARFLGPDLYGSFALAINFVLIFSFLPELGLTAILTRELSKRKEEKEKIFNEVLSFSLFLSLISYVLIILLGVIIIKDIRSLKLLPILGIMMIFDVLREFAYAVYRAELKGELQGILHFLTNLLLFIFGLYSLIKFNTTIALAYAYFFSIGLGFILSILFLGKLLKTFKFIFDLNIYKLYFKSSWPIAIANALYLLLLFTDSIILGWFYPSYFVGIYNSAVKVNEFLILFPTGVSLALLPLFSSNLNNKEELRKTMEFGIYLNYLIVIPIILSIFILSDKLIILVFGENYFTATYGLKILIPSLLANSIFMVFSQFLIAIDRRVELLIYEFIGYITNVLLNLILIPKFDFIAASYTTTFSSFLTFLLGYFAIQKYLSFNLWQDITKPLLASLILSLFLILVTKFSLIFSIIGGIFVYFLTLVLLKDKIFSELPRYLRLSR
jgi:O-antigen/teichoic acid export membrane protein